MKKTIGKPDNWNDFEELCKRLWGEIWEIPYTIKKNGRLGQEQAGVDVYGKPKGKNEYWGIQCKGKDEYSKAKLKKKEIDDEIEKAKKFKPKLKVYIIATSANKDAKIEEYVRLKDLENQEKGLFEIHLFCWEDIVDFIEFNPTTYHWYLHGIGQKGKFDFKISFNSLEDTLTLNPTFEKEITKYQLSNKTDLELMQQSLDSRMNFAELLKPNYLLHFNHNRVNKSWCQFDLVMENIGSMVLEDWRLKVKFLEGVRKLDEGNPLFPKISLTTFVDNKTKSITYQPRDNEPLIQKDNRYFEVSLLIEHETDKIVAEWELLARDFSRADKFEIKVKPEFIEKIKFEEVNSESELKENDIFISDHVVDKE